MMSREGSTPERQEQYKSELRNALLTGYEVLQAGGEAMDAVVAAVGVMEGVQWPWALLLKHRRSSSSQFFHQIAPSSTPAKVPYSMSMGRCVFLLF